MIEILSDMEQSSPEWFAARCGSVGGSSVKLACSGGQGKTRKTLAYQLIGEKYTGTKHAIFQNDAMKWGIETEPQAREFFEFSEGLPVNEVGLVKNSEYHGLHASPDGLIYDGDAVVSGIEIKCPQPPAHIKYLLEGRLPLDYVHQVQFTMLICELDNYWFMSYHPSFPRQLILNVKRDDKFIADMQKKLEVFFSEMTAIEAKIAG